ncbi:related to NmrA-like family protein [Cephalotrichum gorgonifer]|uniref:Related to NmrA-like family protein n=1 Tax=Cephalotrichum gorgonifer TaxID=2041049 RepID=A0AAE8SYV9_9PEZI|nr:related to NmrA-like family protein [Cephalotrichum gorgonifer]
MATIQRVAIFGASGHFGVPITDALVTAGFDVTIITRAESSSTFPDGIPVIRTSYTIGKLTEALRGQDAAVCVVGIPGIPHHKAMIDAAEAAGVKRFILNEFDWGPDFQGLPEFNDISAGRAEGRNHAAALAEANHNFTYTGIAIGNPIDWALRAFPFMGFNIPERSAVIFDAGTEQFTATTLQGIGQAVVGVLRKPAETANRRVKVRSLKVCQNEILEAFEKATGNAWDVKRGSTKDLLVSGRRKKGEGDGSWVMDLVVAQLYEEGVGRSIVAASREESDADLLGVEEETVDGVVGKALKG